MNPYAKPHIQAMGTYAPPVEGRRAYTGCLLDFNERTTPVSPAVQAAIEAFVKEGKYQVYPEYGDCNAKIAAYVGVDPAEVMITNGSDQGIDLLFRTFTEKGETVIIPAPSFAMFDQAAGYVGNKVISPSYRADLAFPLEEVLETLQPGVKLVVICNPNNPTGTLLTLAEIETIAQKAETVGAIVYVDEAYYEFGLVTAASLINKYKNIVITRTFSKAFGLAALRIASVISCVENIWELIKVRGPYDVNMLGVVAAEAALKDRASTEVYVTEVMTQAKPLLENFFRDNNIPFFQSGSNFILFKPQNPEKTFAALKEKGSLLRPRKGQNIDGTLRVTVGTMSQMQDFIAAYRTLLSQKAEKYAFLDRDGALIFEPQDTYQIDSLEKLQILPSVIEGLQKLIAQGYKLALISNQDGLGTASFPQANFDAPQNRMLEIFKENGITFEKIFVCPHFADAGCACRKPKTGLVDGFFKTTVVDKANSFMYGDRDTDRQFAKNIGVRFVKAQTNGAFSTHGFAMCL